MRLYWLLALLAGCATAPQSTLDLTDDVSRPTYGTSSADAIPAPSDRTGHTFALQCVRHMNDTRQSPYGLWVMDVTANDVLHIIPLQFCKATISEKVDLSPPQSMLEWVEERATQWNGGEEIPDTMIPTQADDDIPPHWSMVWLGLGGAALLIGGVWVMSEWLRGRTR